MGHHLLIVHYLTGQRADHADILPIGPHRDLLIGRGTTAAIRIPPEESTVSRAHARIRVTNTRPLALVLENLASEAGTFLKQVRLRGPEVLQAGDSIRLRVAGPGFVVALE